jgi:hypothetical protein
VANSPKWTPAASNLHIEMLKWMLSKQRHNQVFTEGGSSMKLGAMTNGKRSEEHINSL